MLEIRAFSNVVALEMIAPNKPKPFDSKNDQDKEKPSISAGFIIFKNSWLGAACSYRHENPTEFERLGRVAGIFMKNWVTAP